MIELYTHPEYDQNVDDWQKYQDLYDAKHKTLIDQKYLWMHEIEYAPKGGARKRRIREQLSRYTNLIEPCISTYQSLFFAEEVLDRELKQGINTDSKLLSAYQNIDGEKNSLPTFAKDKALESILLFGRSFIYVDIPSAQVATLGEQRAKGIRPYLKLLNPLDVKDWQVDPITGQLLKIRWEYEQVEPRASLSEKPQVSLYSRSYSLEGAVVNYETHKRSQDDNKQATWTLVESGVVVNQTQIPVAYNISGESWIKDGSEIQLKLFNLESCYDNDLHYQAYDRLFVIGNVSEESKKVLKSYTVTFLPEGSTVQKIEAATSTLMKERIEKAFRSFVNVQFNRTFSLSSDSRESPGPEAISAGRKELVELIKSTASELENLINDAMAIYFRYLNTEAPGEFKLNKDITIEDVNEQIALYQAHVDDIKKVPRWHKDYLKKVAEDQNLESIEAILSDIENTNFTANTSIASSEGRPSDIRSAVRKRLETQLNGNIEEASTDS